MKEKEKSVDPQKTKQKYAELLCDFMFKRLFGSEANKDVLIAFLNTVLEDVEIVHVDFIPTEHIGFTEEDRKVVFDISCRCKDGSSFIIEMQKGYQKYFRERALYYTTYPINEQGREAHDLYLKRKATGEAGPRFDWDYNLRPVTVVAILNFSFAHCEGWSIGQFRSSYRLYEDSRCEVMTDALRFVFLELGRFNKHLWELETVTDKWMYLLKHMHEMDEIPKKFSDPLFTRLFLLAEIDNFTAEEKKQYYKSLEDMGDYLNIINTAAEIAEKRGHAAGHAAGREEGRAEGLKEGMEKGRAEMVQKMLEAGMSVSQVADITGLQLDTIEEISNSVNR